MCIRDSHIGNDHSGSIGFQSSLKFLRLDLMSSKSVDAVLAAVAHELLGNGGQRTDDYNCRACESQIEVQQTSACSIPGGRRREATNMGKDFP